MEFVDTHCHIHEIGAKLAGDQFVAKKWADTGKDDPDKIIIEARQVGVRGFICVGTSLEDSEMAIRFVQNRLGCYASVGIHPHEAKDYTNDTTKLQRFCNLVVKEPVIGKIVAVGECGLDYYYEHSPKGDQKKLLKLQIELSLKHNLPLIFHVRDAFDDFWAILDEYKQARGVIHSFTANARVLDQALSRGLYIGLNGIITFTKDQGQLAAAKTVPMDRLLLETDAPFLTPVPMRGTICEPKHVRITAEFLSALKGIAFEQLAAATTANAEELFKL